MSDRVAVLCEGRLQQLDAPRQVYDHPVNAFVANFIGASNLFEGRRDLNGTMLEFEKAWAARKTPNLAQLMASTLVSAGLYEQAEVWARRALDYRTAGVRGLFSQDDEKSRQLLKAIHAIQQADHSGNQTR